jgi:hypothetical protein
MMIGQEVILYVASGNPMKSSMCRVTDTCKMWDTFLNNLLFLLQRIIMEDNTRAGSKTPLLLLHLIT